MEKDLNVMAAGWEEAAKDRVKLALRGAIARGNEEVSMMGGIDRVKSMAINLDRNRRIVRVSADNVESLIQDLEGGEAREEITHEAAERFEFDDGYEDVIYVGGRGTITWVSRPPSLMENSKALPLRWKDTPTQTQTW